MKIERAKVLSGIFTGVLTGGLTFSVFALSGCGKSGGNSDLNACGGTTANTRAGAFSEKIFFVASNQQDSTIVCSFDLKIKGLREEFIPPADSNDVTLFLDEGSAHLFVNERWSGKQSRPSRITSLDSAGGVQTEIAKLPGNLHDLLKLRDGTFVAAGFDKGEFAHVTLQGNFIRATKTLAGLRGTIDDADSRLDTFLNAANRTFVVSQGFELSTFKPTLAKIHRLSSDLSGIEKTFPVQSSDGLKTCENAYAVQPVSAGRAVLSCNPQYFGPTAATLQLVLVDVAQDPPAFEFLKTYSAQDVQLVEVHGATRDGLNVLVEERTNSQSDYAGTVKKRYWLNLSSKAETVEKNVGGSFVYNSATQSYVFNCAVDLATGGCRTRTFATVLGTDLEALFQPGNSGNPGTSLNAGLVSVPSIVGFSKFHKPLILEK